VIDNVKARLLDRGFTFAEKIPAVDKQFVLFRSPELVRAQRAVSALDTAADVLPWLTIALAFAAVAVAPRGRRLRALSLAGLSLVLAMLVLAIALLIGRALYLDAMPPDILAPDAAAATIDTVLDPLRLALRAVAVLGLVVAVGAYLLGGSASATAVRRGFGHGLDSVQRIRRSRPPNAFEESLFRARIALRSAIIGIAALLLVFWSYPTGLVVLLIAVFGLLALLILELVIRPAKDWAAQDRSEESDPPDQQTPDEATPAIETVWVRRRSPPRSRRPRHADGGRARPWRWPSPRSCSRWPPPASSACWASWRSVVSVPSSSSPRCTGSSSAVVSSASSRPLSRSCRWRFSWCSSFASDSSGS